MASQLGAAQPGAGLALLYDGVQGLIGTGWSDRAVFVLGTVLVHEAVFIGLNVLLWLLHVTRIADRWKIQRERSPSRELVLRTLRSLAVSHVLVQPLQLYLLYPIFLWSGMALSRESLASVSWLSLVAFFAGALAINETGFYWSHRLLHSNAWLYRKVHAQHHMYGAPIGLSAEYAHWFEALISNGLPTIGGALLLGPHVAVFWLWLACRIVLTVENHSGYAWPFSPLHMLPGTSHALAHDYHHSHNRGMYGATFGLWDWLCGTDADFRAYLKARGAA